MRGAGEPHRRAGEAVIMGAHSCIYCDETKSQDDLSLEHAIPRFLGGAYAPDKFKIPNCCKKCNSNLGLYVDASFAKTWWVSNWLSFAAQAAYDRQNNPISVPLICMGPTEHVLPAMRADEVCELWLGPAGEQIYWVRPHDQKFWWYIGGNPISAKQKESRAYFYLSERTHLDVDRTWLSFRDAFARTEVRKIMCTTISGADPADIGFAVADDIDTQRITFIRDKVVVQSGQKTSPNLKSDYDHRFLSKLALGVGYAIYGDEFRTANYTRELRAGLWYREGNPIPKVRGVPALQEREPAFLEMSGRPHAATLLISRAQDFISLNLNICQKLVWTVMCGDKNELPAEGTSWIGDGQVIVLYEYLKQSVAMTLPELVGHASGNHPHAALGAIEQRLRST